jgi:SAM-dependent methyltransferase
VTSSSAADYEAIKQRMRAIWGMGDYSKASGILEPAAIALSEACAVGAGDEVLDVGAGDGNFAAAAARAGARVVATDLSPVMVERGRERTVREGLEVAWSEADAEALPFDEGRFDCVASSFGVIAAPRPDVAASELARVTRPGGRVGVTAWPDDGVMSELSAVSMTFVPDGSTQPPRSWGSEAGVRELLGPVAAELRIERRRLHVREDSAATLLDRMASAGGPFRALRDSLPPARAEALARALIEVIEGRNEADDGSLSLRPEYLLVVANKP